MVGWMDGQKGANMKYEKGDKFIIEVESILDEQVGLYKIRGFRTLVFDDYGLDKLEQVQEHDGCDGCECASKDKNEYPCYACKHNYKDRWKRKTKEIQVGDEVEHDLFCKAVVYQVSGANLCVVREKDGKLVTTLWGKEYCTRTGKTYPELIKALAELPKEGE